MSAGVENKTDLIWVMLAVADAVNRFLQKVFLVVPQDNPDELDWD